MKFLSPSDALCLSTRFSVAAGFTVETFFKKKVDCDSHVVPLRTVNLFELVANHISELVVSHSRTSSFLWLRVSYLLPLLLS